MIVLLDGRLELDGETVAAPAVIAIGAGDLDNCLQFAEDEPPIELRGEVSRRDGNGLATHYGISLFTGDSAHVRPQLQRIERWIEQHPGQPETEPDGLSLHVAM